MKNVAIILAAVFSFVAPAQSAVEMHPARAGTKAADDSLSFDSDWRFVRADASGAEALWCAFDHGSLVGKKSGGMSFMDV